MISRKESMWTLTLVLGNLMYMIAVVSYNIKMQKPIVAYDYCHIINISFIAMSLIVLLCIFNNKTFVRIAKSILYISIFCILCTLVSIIHYPDIIDNVLFMIGLYYGIMALQEATGLKPSGNISEDNKVTKNLFYINAFLCVLSFLTILPSSHILSCGLVVMLYYMGYGNKFKDKVFINMILMLNLLDITRLLLPDFIGDISGAFLAFIVLMVSIIKRYNIPVYLACLVYYDLLHINPWMHMPITPIMCILAVTVLSLNQLYCDVESKVQRYFT